MDALSHVLTSDFEFALKTDFAGWVIFVCLRLRGASAVHTSTYFCFVSCLDEFADCDLVLGDIQR